MSCVVFDNSTNNAADYTSWFIGTNPPIAVPSNLTNNTRDANVVTSVLTIVNVSLYDNGSEYFCLPSLTIFSNVGIVSVVGEYEWLYSYSMYVRSYVHTCHDICMHTFIMSPMKSLSCCK